MPYLRIQTNQELGHHKKQELLQQASSAVATGLGKPEKYVMVSIAPMQPMVFAGSDAPCAYLELKSIGLPTNKTKDLSSALCQLIHDTTGIKANRVYIEFADAPREMWGWDGGTF